MVKIEDLQVRTDDEWLSSNQEPLPFCIWETFQINWMRKIPNLYIRPKGGDIYADYIIFLISSNRINTHWR